MYDWTSFDTVFRHKPDYSLENKQTDSISRERKHFGGVLFFDKISSSIGLKQPQKFYPPASNSDLRALWSKVTSSPVSDEKKQAVLLYVLRDCAGSRLPHVDTTFAQKTYLPLKYQILINGLWELDHAHFPRALEYLTDPTLSAEFSDDILFALIRSEKCNDEFAMAYYTTVSPPLTKQETLNAYFGLLIRTNVVEAYRFVRKQDGLKRRSLFEEALRFVHEEGGPERADRAATFLGLPFSVEEEQWFEDYLMSGEGSGLPGAKDSIIMRRIAAGCVADSTSALDRYRGTKVDGVDWDDIRRMQRIS